MDYTYLIFVVPALILSMIAQGLVKSRFATFNKIKSKRNISGATAASLLLRANGITDVKVSHISGTLSDHYNPTTKVLNLSDSTYASTSIAAIGVAAHETGHAIQHNVSYAPLALRSTLVPIANIGSRFGPIIAIVGLMLGMDATSDFALAQLIINIGIILFSGAVLFYLITLPVEFNASKRALAILEQTNTLDREELNGAKKVLWAAAMTYVASALTAVGSLLRLILLSRNRRR